MNQQKDMNEDEDMVNDNQAMTSNDDESMQESAYTQQDNSYTFMTNNGDSVEINPIMHATMVINWADITMYIDPAEGVESYNDFNAPDVVLVTHEHGDHFNLEVLEEIVTQDVELIVNDGVYQKL